MHKMITKIKIIFYKFLAFYFPNIVSPYTYNKALRLEGIRCGDKTKFFQPRTQLIDRERPFMLEIGNYCKITKGCSSLAHDYSRSVLRRAYGEYLGEAGKTIIGDNVFIGMNSIILMGTHIGDNVIIGAGSVVSGYIPNNCVAAGNPARVIRTLDEHFVIRKKKNILEAKLYHDSFVNFYKREPHSNEMGPFIPLYTKRTKNDIINSGIRINLSGDNKYDVLNNLLQTKPLFESYEEFVNYCKNKGDEN